MSSPADNPGRNSLIRQKPVRTTLLLCAGGIVLNLLLNKLAALAGIPLYLDSVGTVLAAVLGGYLPGMLVGYLTNILLWLTGNETAIYYGVISVLLAAMASFLARKDWFRSFTGALRSVPLLALIGGGLGSLLTFGLYGLDFGEELSANLAHFFYDNGLQSVFLAQLLGDIIIDLADKLLTVLFVCLIMSLIPEKLIPGMRLRFWMQNPVSAEERKAARSYKIRKLSLRPKFMMLVMSAMLIIAIVTTGIGYRLYRENMIEAKAEMGRGVTRVLASMMDPDKVDEYLTLGDNAPGYQEIDQAMASVRDSSDDISYVYVYQIREDGCHVVFDPDTPDEPGSDPGEVVAFDADFSGSLDDLITGKPIEEEWDKEYYGET